MFSSSNLWARWCHVLVFLLQLNIQTHLLRPLLRNMFSICLLFLMDALFVLVNYALFVFLCFFFWSYFWFLLPLLFSLVSNISQLSRLGGGEGGREDASKSLVCCLGRKIYIWQRLSSFISQFLNILWSDLNPLQILLLIVLICLFQWMKWIFDLWQRGLCSLRPSFHVVIIC